jgi:hypothetical protein
MSIKFRLRIELMSSGHVTGNVSFVSRVTLWYFTSVDHGIGWGPISIAGRFFGAQHRVKYII